MSEPEKSLGCVAFVGLGVMGFPIAGHLSQIAQRVQVYNRTQEVARRWIETYPGSGVLCDSPKDAAIGADVVFMCVGNDADVLDEVVANRTRNR